ncbi:MAG: Clp protease N-terminal domain-containing protein [Polaromonas sp.]
MFNAIKQRFRDVSTIKALCFGAEKLANADGQKEPGAEHFVLMALELPDGTARKAFKRLHADPDSFCVAIARQYDDALQNIGIALPPDAAITDEATPLPTGTGLYKTQSSAQALMQTLTKEIMVKEQKANLAAPLLGAHVILAATTAQYGVAVRAFQAMGIDPKKLAEAATAEIIASRTA